MSILGPIAAEQQQTDPGEALGQAPEYRLRLAVDPLQILEHERHRLHLALTQQEALDGLQGTLPPPGRVERLPRPVVHGQVEQGQERRQGDLERRVQGEELAGDLLADGALVIAVADPAVGLEQVDHGEIGRGLAVGDGARFQHEPAGNVTASG